ncbi:MAG: maltotransferase domain-containing protein [Janthinobacterium lividum]
MTARLTTPRIYFVPLSMVSGPAEWAMILDGCVGMGFDTVLTSSPNDPGPRSNALLPYDWAVPHPALGTSGSLADAVAFLAKACRARGLRLMVDLVADRVACDGPLAEDLGLARPYPALPDPRVAPELRGSVSVPFHDDAIRGLCADRLTEYVATLVTAGVQGFRCLGVDKVPAEVWAEAKAKARSVSPDVTFLAWTPGLPAESIPTLSRAGFDGSFSSLCWWDCRAAWPVDEYERLAALGPVLAFPEAPFGRRLAESLVPSAVAMRDAERALWVTASLGDGILLPMGFEFGAREPVPPTGAVRETYAVLRSAPRLPLAEAVRAANASLLGGRDRFVGGEMRIVQGAPNAPTAIQRADAKDLRQAKGARLVLVNPSLDRSATLAPGSLAQALGGSFPFRDVLGSEPDLAVDTGSVLPPGAVRLYEGSPTREIHLPVDALRYSPETAIKAPRLVIESVSPAVDGGRYPVKRIVGDVMRIEVDAFGEGHDRIAVALQWRAADEPHWQERRMQALGNDRWTADLPLERMGRYIYRIETWRDDFAMFRHEVEAKHGVGLAVPLELEEGCRLVERALKSATTEAASRLKPISARLAKAGDAERLALLLASETDDAMKAADPRLFSTVSSDIPVEAERKGAGFASWYSIFPRSQSGDPQRHGTFDDVIGRLPTIRAMGFDVLYFTPIHPIGRTNRKGRNNSLTAGPDDPGSPYAIGAAEGGHSAIHPELGTFEDFRRLVAAAADHGLELAMDIAIQASPDHPWLKDHPEWFNWRPDGTIRYAENPPKKYEDIVNVDFYTPGAMPSLWIELRDMIMLWVEQGVKLFRVDNPHTKPFPFWEWAIEDIRQHHPDVIFLSEAFTKPKVMYRLAKVGFSQSYTYFTWRNTKYELTDYLTELTTQPPKEFFRPHFFVNTHDINPDFLQDAPRPAFLIRAALATTLSGLWGVYNGFELCEGRPDQKRKEYANSEKYQLTAWDHDRPGNIIGEITQLNRIRRDNPALQSHLGITFLTAYNDNILLFEKATPSRDNVLLVAVSLDPYAAQEADIELPLWKWGLPDQGTVAVEDLMRGSSFAWSGKRQRIRLDPSDSPFSIWRLNAARTF